MVLSVILIILITATQQQHIVKLVVPLIHLKKEDLEKLRGNVKRRWKLLLDLRFCYFCEKFLIKLSLHRPIFSSLSRKQFLTDPKIELCN